MSSRAEPEITETYHIFLASPGDMKEERKMVRTFFEQYNCNFANRQNLEFKVIDWEHYSNIGVGRPQMLITDQTLDEFKNSLILVVGLLGQRFGTPTGEYESGTEEEFETAISFRNQHGDWPEIKWFFREQWGNDGAPADPDASIEAGQQWKKVRDFMKKIQTGEPPLWTRSFPTTDDFPDIFRTDLERWLNDPARPWRHHNTPRSNAPTTRTEESPYLKTWLNLLARDCASLPLGKLDARQGLEHADPIRLPDVFVPLKAIAPPKVWEKSEGQNLQLAREMATGKTGEPEPILDLLEQHRRAVLIGDPGSGKSALVNQLTWSLVDPEANQTLPGYLQGRIPLRIILRRVEIPAQAKQGEASWIWDTVEKDIKEQLETHQKVGQHAIAVVESIKSKLMQQPGGLILLDGLDEVSTANLHRTRLLQAIQAFVAGLPDYTRVIVTARPYAYTDPQWRLGDFTAFFLTPFDREQRQQFIEGWYEAGRVHFGLRDADLKQQIPDLLDRVENRQHLKELAERPLLLTLISTLHASGGRLPEDRVQLYADSVDLLLYRWRREVFRDSDGLPLRLDEHELRKCLQNLAYSAHKAQRHQADLEDTADISHDQLFQAFDPMLEKLLCREDLLGFLQQHTGILIDRGQDHFAFPHHSFQEYLAMGWLTKQNDDVLSPKVCEDPLWWREVFLLAVVDQRQNPRFAVSYIRDLLERGEACADEIQYRLKVLSALALAELDKKRTDDLTHTVRQGLVNLIEDTTALNVNERAEAGSVLGRIGDPRPGVGVTSKGLPDIDWVQIPAGEVTLENHAGKFSVQSFYLARYPVTHAQFQSFIDDPKGYSNPQWWAKLDEEPGTPVIPVWREANHPRETVSWFEAMAFCAWLSDRLGYEVTLPTEWQWQQAACSGQSEYDFPWGPKYKTGYANINETWDDSGPYDIERTTAVGLYPQGDSLQGVSDLSGNVWEWCLNSYENPDETQASSTFRRVVRGGSWIHSQDDARASYRYGSSPDNRLNNIGFRLCCLSPI